MLGGKMICRHYLKLLINISVLIPQYSRNMQILHSQEIAGLFLKQQ